MFVALHVYLTASLLHHVHYAGLLQDVLKPCIACPEPDG